MSGTLYGIGVGPGDPELLTLKAHRLLNNANVIAYPAPDDGESFARSIVAQFIPHGVQEIPIVIPMRVERFPAATIYDEKAEEIARHLSGGEDVVVLCEGDPFFYGSFMYLFERLVEHFPCEVVPGVSSLMASATTSARPLAARNDILTVLPAPLPNEVLIPAIRKADAIAFIKVGRHLARLRALIEAERLTQRAGYVERVSLANQRILPLADVEDCAAPYFSMVLIYKGAETWIKDLKLAGNDG